MGILLDEIVQVSVPHSLLNLMSEKLKIRETFCKDLHLIIYYLCKMFSFSSSEIHLVNKFKTGKFVNC